MTKIIDPESSCFAFVHIPRTNNLARILFLKIGFTDGKAASYHVRKRPSKACRVKFRFELVIFWSENLPYCTILNSPVLSHFATVPLGTSDAILRRMEKASSERRLRQPLVFLRGTKSAGIAASVFCRASVGSAAAKTKLVAKFNCQNGIKGAKLCLNRRYIPKPSPILFL